MNSRANFWRALASMVLLFFVLIPALAADMVQTDYVVARLKSASTAIQAGKPFEILVDLQMSPGWHTYYKDPGEAGMPTKIEWTLPQGFKAGDIQWPRPEKFTDAGIVTYGYVNRVVLKTKVTPPAKLPPANSLAFTAQVKWLVCKDLCVPGKATLSLTIPVAKEKIVTVVPPKQKQDTVKQQPPGEQQAQIASPKPTDAQVKSINVLDQNLDFSCGSQGLGHCLLFAFIGGIILNVMPCVLPVISIKVLSFVKQASDDPKRVFALGATFSAGIIVTFLALACLVIAIRRAGQDVGWGFQFQHPAFLVAMATLVTLFALSLFDLFHISLPGHQGIDELANKEGFVGTFFKGVLATTLSTPCTAPFLGTAIGFAFTQPASIILAVFFTVGLGMACPYLILTAKPNWMKHLPKPGQWMHTFKQAMGFFLLGSVIWLLWVLGKQVGVDPVISALKFLFSVAFAIWASANLVDLRASHAKRYTVWTCCLAFVVASYFYCIAGVPGLGKPMPEPSNETKQADATSPDKITWIPFTVAKLNDELTNGKTVFLDFTADWCLTCKANEQVVINTKPVIDKFKSLNVVALRADWTTQNPEITQLMKKFGRSGVPLYVIFPAKDPRHPLLLPEVVTKTIVIEKLDQAGASIH